MLRLLNSIHTIRIHFTRANFNLYQIGFNAHCISCWPEYFSLSMDFYISEMHYFRNKLQKLRVLTPEGPNKHQLLKNESIYMHIDVWSFSLYWSLLQCIFTDILLLFSTPGFSLSKKLFCFLQNASENFDQDLYIPLHTIIALSVRFYNLGCFVYLENNLSLHKFFWRLGW
jgi:hypothetical protein